MSVDLVGHLDGTTTCRSDIQNTLLGRAEIPSQIGKLGMILQFLRI
jgi:hypothetical protein